MIPKTTLKALRWQGDTHWWKLKVNKAVVSCDLCSKEKHFRTWKIKIPNNGQEKTCGPLVSTSDDAQRGSGKYVNRFSK